MSSFSDRVYDESIKKEQYIDPDSGKVVVNYYYKRKKCPSIEIKGPIAKRMAGFCLILTDLEQSQIWLEQCYEFRSRYSPSRQKIEGKSNYFGVTGPESNISRSLFFSSVIFYAKCFTKAKGRGIKLEKSQLDPNFHDKHDQIMEVRHCLAAHSGVHKIHDKGVINLILPPKKGTDLSWRLRPEFNILNSIDDRQAGDGFLALIKSTNKYVRKKTDEVGKRVMEEITLKGNEDYWRSRAR
jgi:hypothetical protein